MVLQLKLKVEGADSCYRGCSIRTTPWEGEFNIILRQRDRGRACYTLLGDSCDYYNAFVRTCGGQDELISTDRRHYEISVHG